MQNCRTEAPSPSEARWTSCFHEGTKHHTLRCNGGKGHINTTQASRELYFSNMVDLVTAPPSDDHPKEGPHSTARFNYQHPTTQ